MQKQKYEINYDCQTIAEVEIGDLNKAMPAIREMVEFWHRWEDRLEDNDGDYLKTWLKQLGNHILCLRESPHNKEGWISLDGERGITLLHWWKYEFDEEMIEIKAKE